MIDCLLDRIWQKNYTCNEFACDAWKLIKGEDLSSKLESHLNGQSEFNSIEEQNSPCLVFMSNTDTSSSHIGIFYNEKVLHLTSKGVQYVPLEIIALYFKKVRFYQ